MVFVVNPKFTEYVQHLGPTFRFSANPLRLEKDGPYSHEMNLGDAIANHTLIQFEENVSFKDIIRSVAEKEAAHYDTNRPINLDKLADVKIQGFPSEYQAIYYVGRVTLSLGYRFLDGVALSRYRDVLRSIEAPAKQKNSNNKEQLWQTVNSLKWILTVWTETTSAMRYAETHNTLGVVFMMLADFEDSEVNLKRALDTFEHTLSVINLDEHPVFFAETQYNFGLVLARLGLKPSEFLDHWRKAEKNFRKADAFDKAERMSQIISDIEGLASD